MRGRLSQLRYYIKRFREIKLESLFKHNPREVKKTRHTIEEIDEKTYKEKVEKSNGLSSEAKAVSVKDCKE